MAADAAGLHELWGKIGVIYRDKPTKPASWRSWVCETRICTKLGVYRTFCFVLSHEFSPNGEVKVLINFAKGRSTTSN